MMLQISGREILEPGTDHRLALLLRISGKLLFRFLQCPEYCLIGMQIRVIKPEISVAVMGRINHRTNIVQALRHLSINLPYRPGIFLAPDNRAEHVSRNEHAERGEAVIGILSEFCNNICF